jgi:hypothetical protein
VGDWRYPDASILLGVSVGADIAPWEIIEAVWDKIPEGFDCIFCPPNKPHICSRSYRRIERYLDAHPEIMQEYHERNLHWEAFQ